MSYHKKNKKEKYLCENSVQKAKGTSMVSWYKVIPIQARCLDFKGKKKRNFHIY